MLNPTQQAVLQDLLSDPATIAANLTGASVDALASILATAEALITTAQALVNDIPFALQLDLHRDGTTELTPQVIVTETRNGRTHLLVDRQLRLIESSVDSAKLIDAQRRTADTQAVEIICHGSYSYCLVGGRIVRERSLVSTSSQAPVVNSWRRPMTEFDEVLGDHFREMIRNERLVRYWSNKPTRELLSDPDGTERIFHTALFWWLDHFIADKIRVYAEPRGFGQDATDIIAVTFSGDYVIEVKWLGRNDKGTSYEQPRIDEGLRQVKIYLESDPRFVAGYVVFYDGRAADKHMNDSAFDPASRHDNCPPPKFVFLESEPPSQVARRAPTRRR